MHCTVTACAQKPNGKEWWEGRKVGVLGLGAFWGLGETKKCQINARKNNIKMSNKGKQGMERVYGGEGGRRENDSNKDMQRKDRFRNMQTAVQGQRSKLRVGIPLFVFCFVFLFVF